MKITTARSEPWRSQTPFLALLLAKGEKLPASAKGAAAGQAKAAMARKDFKGEARETALIYADGKDGPARLLLVGLGAAKSVDAEGLRRASAIVQARAASLSVSKYVLMSPTKAGDLNDAEVGEALAEGAVLGSFHYEAPRRDAKKPKASPNMEVCGTKSARFEAGLNHGRVCAEGTNTARDLSVRPANSVTPSELARTARAIARKGGIHCRVLGQRELESLEMGGILSVTRGTREPPKMIILDHKPRGAKATICLVGKGITFDSGGLSLKPPKAMEEMKYDMCGAAAVIGTMQVVAALKPKVRVVGLVPACENMPSGTATKPGDVIRMHGGLTVEVKNTDAEGRLILGDALEYAKRYEPDATIDVATLTGAMVIALGHETTGFMSTDDKLSERLHDAGEKTGERAWRLPLYPEYGESMRSDVADLSNIGAPGAGSITAGYFLSRFAEGLRWAHMDIAGTAWNQRARDYYKKGPSGVGVRMLTRLIEDWN